MKTVHEHLAEILEGGLFYFYAIYTSGAALILDKMPHTVKNGIVYEIINNKLYETGDPLINIESKCIRVGQYDEHKHYDRDRVELSTKDLGDIFKKYLK